MSDNEILDIIKTKYNSKEFDYHWDSSVLSVKYHGYYFRISNTYGNINFRLSHPPVGYKSIETTMVKYLGDNINDRVLNNFSIMIRCIKKIEYFNKQKQECLDICEPLMLKFITDNYQLELNKENKTINPYNKLVYPDNINWHVQINLPKTIIFGRRRTRQTNFDLLKEKKRKLTYYINFKVNHEKITYLFDFTYQSSENILHLISENIYYNEEKDISNIIRSEKLKKLMFNE